MSTLFGIQDAGCCNNAQFSLESREREREFCDDDTRLNIGYSINYRLLLPYIIAL